MKECGPFLSLDAKHYEPQEIEQKIYEMWETRGVFTADNTSTKKPYSIVIPPPNVTGRLHMGHALNNSIQDVLIRYKRMDGYDALWVPGTDHAGISTQSVVKKHLDAEGINYRELGREKMIERIWEWKEKYGNQILRQLRRLGASCDWTRTRFTMDEGLSHAVKVAFVRLYEKGLVYRGKYIVNWCPIDRTALSNDEVHTKEGGEPGHLWHFRYPLTSGDGHVTIATTRPETMLGDTAIAVNPKDDRYTDLVGQSVTLPLVGRKIPIIADDYVDASFGTGCLKVTPAHDLNDFQIGLRHDLEQINIMNEDATINDEAPEAFRGLDRFVAREKIVSAMDELGLLEKIEDRMTPVGRSERSKAIIEYRLSDQWFVKMRPLADLALKASEEGRIEISPERWDRVYRDWLENTRDWCISRQIWWGHRIPAWYHKESGEILVGVDTPSQVLENPEAWEQETDVLDTWFSSALWPYSTLGWPEMDAADLNRYYPTNLLSTAKDIIYLWVARMAMTGLFHMEDVPFHHVYFHPTICDEDGETMSKSKGNGIDPLHVIDGATTAELEGPINEARPHNMEMMLERLHQLFPDGFKGVGADALRFSLLTLNSEAQQVQISLRRFEEIGKRFTDKLWNASRFVMQNFSHVPNTSEGLADSQIEDEWILGRLDRCTAQLRESLNTYRFNVGFEAVYHFFWDDFCDWYLELTKDRLKTGSPSDIRRVQMTLGEVLGNVLRLLHPAMPFITEELWGHLLPRLTAGELLSETISPDTLCAQSPFPVDQKRFTESLDNNFEIYREVVRSLRNMRVGANLSPKLELEAFVFPMDEKVGETILSGETIISRASGLKSLSLVSQKPEKMSVTVIPGAEIYLNVAEHLDVEAELSRNEKVLEKLDKRVAQLEA
ncbi:MAG: valine--tRNA ligase, partial [Bdellovibrionales bacterium]|nr:valine--tRNA ligase [Bdellovibrionales bacterium]